MRNIILDTAISIDGFKNIEGLIDAINSKSALMASNEKQIFEGFMLILRELEDDITLQRNTFYQTMLNVKDQYAIRNRHTAIQMNAITLAIAHVRDCLKIKRIRKQVGGTTKCLG